MLKKLTLATVVATTALVTVPSVAEINQKSGRTVEQVYKQCGLGGMLFGNSSEILAIISNVTWDLGTTAALSDMSSPETCSTGVMKTATLINETFPSMEKDLAAGQGAYLSALNSVAQCSANSAVRSQYGAYTQTPAYTLASKQQKVNTLFNIVDRSCSL